MIDLYTADLLPDDPQQQARMMERSVLTSLSQTLGDVETLPVARELQAYAKYLQPWHQEKFEQTEKGSKAFAYHQFFLQVAQATNTKVLLKLCNQVKYQR